MRLKGNWDPSWWIAVVCYCMTYPRYHRSSRRRYSLWARERTPNPLHPIIHSRADSTHEREQYAHLPCRNCTSPWAWLYAHALLGHERKRAAVCQGA